MSESIELKEQRTACTVLVKNSESVIVARVDGNPRFKFSGRKCDYYVALYRNDPKRFVLIELKGKKVFDAIEQLRNTIKNIVAEYSAYQLRDAYAIIRGISIPTTRAQNVRAEFKKLHNFNFAIYKTGCQINLD